MDDRRGAEGSRGAEMLALAGELFPICRSITGRGIRQSLAILNRYIPLEIHHVPTGTHVFDWAIPREWNVRSAYLANLEGTRIVDFASNNLHIVQYSQPMDEIISLEKLRAHLHTLPEHPDWIPYRTSYYNDNWGFCLSHRDYSKMSDEYYHVMIDSDLSVGHLSYGELLIPGACEDTVLFSIHICHPSLANDNLSGAVVATMLAQELLSRTLRCTYRFVFIPGTIGSLTWLARNESELGRISHGLVLSCLGDAGGMTYKRTRRGSAHIDRIVSHVLSNEGNPYRLFDFSPYGYDERQYCSPGFDLPVGCLMRTPNGEYPEYHSSADNMSLLRAGSLDHSLSVLRRIVDIIESNIYWRNKFPKGEPQLGRRGLYGAMGGKHSAQPDQLSLLWVLNLADGQHSLLDIAERAGLSFEKINAATDALFKAGLLTSVGDALPTGAASGA